MVTGVRGALKIQQDEYEAIPWVDVESSNLEKVAFRDHVTLGPEKGHLYVQFRGGGSFYQYLSVPKTLYVEMLSAESKGKFLHSRIKPEFGYLKYEVEPCQNSTK